MKRDLSKTEVKSFVIQLDVPLYRRLKMAATLTEKSMVAIISSGLRRELGIIEKRLDGAK